jgi:hypothetical protein
VTAAIRGAIAAAALAGCAPAPRAPSAKEAPGAGCHYEARVVAGVAQLEVDVTCAGGVSALRASSAAVVPYVTLHASDGSPVSAAGGAWELPPRDGRARYRIDLDRLAARADDFDVALRVGESLIAPASSFLLEPRPVPVGAPVTLRVAPAPGRGFATGLRRSGALHRLEAHEIRVATYCVFGRFSKRSIALAGLPAAGEARLDVVVLDAPLQVAQPVLQSWIGDSARLIGAFWGGFPVGTALVAVVPVEQRAGVVFGKLLPASLPTVTLMLGDQSDRAALYDDWVLVHELFHLGSPSYVGEGKWLDEGLATYFEPLLRARAGWITEQALWSELAHGMPQGLFSLEHEGLERASSYRSIYWGGAVLALLADARARERSGGRLGLEDGLREVLARGGDATRVWDLRESIDVIDARLGAPILGELASRHAFSAAPLDLDALWRDLGVERSAAGVHLRDDAPRAWVRRAIVRGAPPAL